MALARRWSRRFTPREPWFVSVTWMTGPVCAWPSAWATGLNLPRLTSVARLASSAGWHDLAKRHGDIHVLINNAARDPRIALEDVTAKVWDDLIAGNIRAYFIACREASPHLAKGASIVNFSSITFYTAPVNMSAYVATKAAAIGLTRSLARELGPRRIRVNTISPGWIMTERQLSDHVTPAVKRQIRREQCIPDLNQPDEVADVALFLASDASRAVTGQEILVDRGWVHG